MDYKIIHDNTIKYIRDTDIKTRIRRRNKEDLRLFSNKIYVEIHHIIPRSLDGVDELYNLIEVLPEEHLFLHMLRYRIYRKREDALAIRYMLNGFSSKKVLNEVKILLNKKIRMGYSWLKTHAYFLRKTEGWHTPQGRNNISKARIGKMPAKDSVTGEMIGAVDVDHPNVISGRWVHHTKGRKQSEEEIEFKRNLYSGQANPNASGLTEEYFIKKGIEMFKEFGFILSWTKMIKLSESRGFKWIKSFRSRFNGKGASEYYRILEDKTNSKFIKGLRVKVH